MSKNPYKVGDCVITDHNNYRTITALGWEGRNLNNRVTLSNNTWCNIDYIRLDPEYHTETIEERIESAKNSSSQYEITSNGKTISNLTFDRFIEYKDTLNVFGYSYTCYKTETTRTKIK